MTSFHTRSAPKLSHKAGKKLRPLPPPQKAKVSMKAVSFFVLGLALFLSLLLYKFILSQESTTKKSSVLASVQKSQLRGGTTVNGRGGVDDDEAAAALLKTNLGLANMKSDIASVG
eukprot:CAMPEP_0197468402 /NCGR_PEP_ID=MMETSP1175-20131217/66063_1 /TAXON_ID=1003142 /ORGANISM="Triceratium dubium, Strain CCMP147" /LENGTH=115 /DNA_ID=CAMNT_0043004499 /DNA_START=156 /DNA_END=503 /DNA_ORIENTATION=+